MKAKTPKRRKKSAAARLRPFWILIASAAALAAGGLAAAAMWPGFAPKDVEVAGNVRVPRAEVLARAQIRPDVNMWLQSAHGIEARVEAIPYVAAAHVTRIPPSTVAIDIRERVPFAVVTDGSRAVLVDRDLRVLAPATAPSDLVTFAAPAGTGLDPGTFLKDESSVGLLATYDRLVAGRVVPIALGYDKFGGIVATVRGGIRIMLGDDDEMPRKIALIDPILAQVVRGGKPADAIDLRAPNTPVVDYRN